MKYSLRIAIIALFLSLSFFAGVAWKHTQVTQTDNDASAPPEAARFRTQNEQLASDNQSLERDASTLKARVVEGLAMIEARDALELARARQTISSNLRTIHSARLQYANKAGKPAASLQQLVQLGYLRGNWINVDAAVAGEQYAALSADPSQPMTVQMENDGPAITFDPSDAAMMAIPIIPGAGPNQDGTDEPTQGEHNTPLVAAEDFEKALFSKPDSAAKGMPAAALAFFSESRGIAHYLEIHPAVRAQLYGLKSVAMALQKDDGIDPSITDTLQANMADVLFRMNNTTNTIQRRINESIEDAATTRQIQALIAVLQKHQPPGPR